MCHVGQMDGEWEPVMIENPKYKGEWRPLRIANPLYVGTWKPRKIPNPGFSEVGCAWEALL